MSLEYLAPELLFLILQSIDSPRSLHDLISASPASFRVFNQTSQLVLLTVIKNTLPAISHKHLLAFHQAPSPASTTGVSSFLDKYFDESSLFNFPTSRADLIELYKLYNKLSFLINGYLNRLKKPGFNDTILAPSPSELTRLQRAFLRYGLYSRVFVSDDTLPWEDPSPNHTFSAREQFDLFISHLKPWECEEIVCVEQYFSTLIGDFVDEMEEQLAEAAKSVLIFQPSKPAGNSECDSRDTSGNDNLWRFAALDLRELSLFSFDNRVRIHRNISYMASLGLDFIYDLIKSDEEERSRLIRSNSPNMRVFLEEALRCSPRSHTDEDDKDHEGSEWDDDPSRNNLGWPRFGLLSQERVYLGIDTRGYHMLPLRELGYVFWDSTRLETTAVCDKLFAAQKMSSEKRKRRYDRRDKETLEARFKGAMIPRREMVRLESQFGSITRPLQDELE